MLWNRKTSAPPADRSRLIGLDLNASRAVGVSVGEGRVRSLVLDDPTDDLLQFISLERRSPDVGRAGYAIVRKQPHLVCSNFLPALGQPRKWQAGRVALTPETALEAVFQKLNALVAPESQALA